MNDLLLLFQPHKTNRVVTKLTRTCWAALARPDDRFTAGGHLACDQAAHLLPVATVTLPAAVVPTLPVVVNVAID